MKRYFVFAYLDYYPAGGMCDFESDHDSKDEAIQAAMILKNNNNGVDVFDTVIGKSVFSL